MYNFYNKTHNILYLNSYGERYISNIFKNKMELWIS